MQLLCAGGSIVSTSRSAAVRMMGLALAVTLVALVSSPMPTGAQSFTEFPVASGLSNRPFQITAGSDGALWFVEFASGKIGRITTAGAVTEFSLPNPRSEPQGITAGPDGALWFTEGGG